MSFDAVTNAFRDLRWSPLLGIRMLAIAVLVFAAPGASQVVRESVALVIGGDCCDEDCDDESEDEHQGADEECPSNCAGCACCAHGAFCSIPSVPVAPMPVLRSVHEASDVSFRDPREQVVASGYHAPPFRPPAV